MLDKARRKRAVKAAKKLSHLRAKKKLKRHVIDAVNEIKRKKNIKNQKKFTKVWCLLK